MGTGHEHRPHLHKGRFGYGYIKDHHDRSADKLFSTHLKVLAPLPASVNLSAQPQPPIYDQGQLGSCTANAAAAMLGFVEAKEGNSVELLSRLFIYWRARVDKGTDEGATIYDSMLCVAQKGVCSEALWPYDISKFADEPPPAEWGDAWHRIAGFDYFRVQTLQDMKSCLAAGYPFEFGIEVYDSFESQTVADTGIVPVPNTRREELLGGHAICAVGYDDARQAVLFRNSWGTNWGLKGLAWIPYKYITNTSLAFDMWTVRKIAR